MTKKFISRRLIIFLLAAVTGAAIAVWFYLVVAKPSPQSLQLINRSPKTMEFEAANTTTPIFLYFDQPIDPSSAVIESNPNSLRLTAAVRPDRPNILVLTPKTPWAANQTVNITIKKNLISPDKNFRLPTDITFQLEIQPLPRPTYDRPS